MVLCCGVTNTLTTQSTQHQRALTWLIRSLWCDVTHQAVVGHHRLHFVEALNYNGHRTRRRIRYQGSIWTNNLNSCGAAIGGGLSALNSNSPPRFIFSATYKHNVVSTLWGCFNGTLCLVWLLSHYKRHWEWQSWKYVSLFFRAAQATRLLRLCTMLWFG